MLLSSYLCVLDPLSRYDLPDAGYDDEKWALIIGGGTLKYTVNDANALYQTLTFILNEFPRD